MALSSNFILALVATVVCVVSSRFTIRPEPSEIQLSHNRDREEVSKDFVCPSSNGRFPHPHSCEYYFECRAGQSRLKQCSRDELYDEEKRDCRDRKKVQCRRDKDDKITKTSRRPDTTKVVKTTTEIPKTTKGVPKNFTCPSIYGRFPHPKNCEYYYECRSGYATLKHCSRGDLYDEDKRECRERRRVDCRRGGDDVPEEKEKDFKCPSSSGAFPHPIDCSKYYVCKYNLPSVFQCQNSELFHDKARRCLHKNRVDCGKRLDRDDMKTSRRPETTKRVKTTTEIPTTTGATFSTTAKNIPVTTPSDTTTITTTSEPTTTTPEPTTTETPEPTTTETPEPTTTKTAEPTTITRLEPTTTVEPTEPTITTTPEPITTTNPTPTTTTTTEAITTTTFVPVTKPNTPPPTDCDESDLDCIIDDTGDVKGWFDCPDRYGHFPHGSSKQLFIHCDNGKPFVKKCADGTVFSPEHLVCVWIY